MREGFQPQLLEELNQFLKDRERKARWQELDKLLAATIFCRGATLSVRPEKKGRCSISARAVDGTPIAVPDFAGIAPDIAETLADIVGRGFIMRFGGDNLTSSLAFRPGERAREVPLREMRLGIWPFSEAVLSFGITSREYVEGVEAVWDY